MPSTRQQNTKRTRRYSNKGKSTKVEPIRTPEEIERVKAVLADNPRNMCLFILGINTAFRACELLSITVGQVAHLQVGDTLEVKQSKNKKYRRVAINGKAYQAIQDWLAHHPHPEMYDAPLFTSYTTQRGLKKDTIYKYVKEWCRKARLIGNYASHSLRKTWGYVVYRNNNPKDSKHGFHRKIAEIMEAFGHARERQTLDYLCIQHESITALYLDNEIG